MLAVRTTINSERISVGGVKLWNGPSMELKQHPTMIQLKKGTAMIFTIYREGGRALKSLLFS